MLTAEDIASIRGWTVSHARRVLRRWRLDGTVRVVQLPSTGGRPAYGVAREDLLALVTR